jgi:hypothetical protein
MQAESHHEVNIDLILDSLDGITPAEPRPFLHTRVMARLERNRSNPWVRTWNFVSRPAVYVSIIGCLMIMNLFTLYQRTNEQGDVREESVAVATVEYEGQSLSYYAFNDDQP